MVKIIKVGTMSAEVRLFAYGWADHDLGLEQIEREEQKEGRCEKKRRKRERIRRRRKQSEG